jgi:hypothetical protein
VDPDDSPDLHRYWIEFEIPPDECPPTPAPGRISLDDGSRRYRMLAEGVGVTGYNLDDCLGMVAEVVEGHLPVVKAVLTDPDMSGPEWNSRLAYSGSPVWRSIWFPLFRDQPRFPQQQD